MTEQKIEQVEKEKPKSNNDLIVEDIELSKAQLESGFITSKKLKNVKVDKTLFNQKHLTYGIGVSYQTKEQQGSKDYSYKKMFLDPYDVAKLKAILNAFTEV